MTKTNLSALLFTLLTSTSACTSLTSESGKAGDAPDGYGEAANAALTAMCPDPGLTANALCVCDDFLMAGDLEVGAGQGGTGSVGVNGVTGFAGTTKIAGKLTSNGFSLGLTGQSMDIGSISTNGSLQIAGNTVSRGDVSVGDGLGVSGNFSIEGSLLMDGEPNGYQVSMASKAAYAGDVAAPCGCGPSDIFDVTAAVAAARTTVGGQDSWQVAGDYAVTLPTGSYYLTQVMLAGASKITIAGSVSLFLDGDLLVAGDHQWVFEPGASLDLYIAGNLLSAGAIQIGDAAHADKLRLFVGGSGLSGQSSIGVAGGGTFYGSVYAPTSRVLLAGGTQIDGSLFAKTLVAAGSLKIAHSISGDAPTSCEQPPAPQDPDVIVE